MTGTTTIAGRYRIEGRLGVGGMSTVHLAFDNRLERYVAIKLLAEHLADDPTFVSRFRREALAAARLVHPNIVQVFDFGFDAGHHQHFIVMEHMPGNSCAELLRDRGHLDVAETIEIVTQACAGLDYAHRNGVVHRDVKPGNLLRLRHRCGQAGRLRDRQATDQSSITQVGSVLGTAAYLSPEQARGDEAGPRADIYSLGVVDLPADLRPAALRGRTRCPSSRSSSSARRPPRWTSSTRRSSRARARRWRCRWRSTRAPAPRTPWSWPRCSVTGPGDRAPGRGGSRVRHQPRHLSNGRCATGRHRRDEGRPAAAGQDR